MKLSLAEIVTRAIEIPTRAAKVEWLRTNDNVPLRTILNIMYNRNNVKLLIPDVPPPYKRHGYLDAEGMLYKEARRLRIFVEGSGYDHIAQHKREALFISLLEDVDDKDGDLLCLMIRQRALKGLPRAVVSEAFPELNLIEESTDQDV